MMNIDLIITIKYLKKMQEDPKYTKMLQKSFIMSRHHQRNPRTPIPQIKKQPTILHRVITTGMLSTLIHCLAYPADTIKIRKMARHKLLDVAKFQANGVSQLTPYLGFFKGYLSILIGNFCFLTLGKQNFFLGVAAQGILKTWIDMSKISSQMGNKSMNMDVAKKIFPTASLFSVLRDLTSRGSYLLTVNALFHQFNHQLTKSPDLKYHMYFGSAIIATLISHPFDLVFTKLVSQRSLKYTGVMGAMRTIVKEEGKSKIYSGVDFRLLYNLVSIIIMGNSYDSLMNITLQAF